MGDTRRLASESACVGHTRRPCNPPPAQPSLGALCVCFVRRACGRFGVDVCAASGRSLSLFRRRLQRFIPASLLRFERSIGVSSSASAVFHSRTALPPPSPPPRLLRWQTNTAFILLSNPPTPLPQLPSPHPFSSSSSEQALCSFLSRITQSAHALVSPASPPLFRGVSGKRVMIVFANLFVCAVAQARTTGLLLVCMGEVNAFARLSFADGGQTVKYFYNNDNVKNV